MSREQENKALVQRFWQQVYEGRDYDRIGEFFADDGEYVDVAIPDSVARGPAAVAKRLRIGHEPVQRFEHVVHRLIAEDSTVITEHTETWFFHTGEVVALPFVSVMEVAGGRIRLWHDYSNIDTLLKGAPQWWLEHIMKFSVEDFTA